MFLAVLTAFMAAEPVCAASISGVDLDKDRITLRFDGAVEKASAFLLDKPRRLAVDVSGARAGRGGGAGGLVSQTRQGQYLPNVARVVFELAEPAVIADGGFAPDGRSLTLSLKPSTSGAFASAVVRGRQSFAQAQSVKAPAAVAAVAVAVQNNVTIPLDPPRPVNALPLPPVSGARGTNRPLVVIDAGHGGHDPGSLSSDGARKEKDAALAIARAIRDELTASGRVRVALTREDDRFLILGERREIARRLGADLFISIHADSAPNKDARGATVYTLSEVASDRVAAQLAAKENKADILNGVDLGGENSEVSSILLDLAQRDTMNVSSAFATLLQREMAPTIAFRTSFHRFAGLIVLKAPDMPSVLLETGYMSNDDDLRLLFSKQYQKNIAIGVRRAVETHFARRLAQK